ncbi:uncharacterized protein DS421_4g126240 [Arachis hypogaea]|nr:uncharacterized protein DS421_4g126240 [Arachis hypogaea]
MPFLAPILRQRFASADIPVTRRSAASIRHDINYIEEFVWQPYLDIIISAKLHHYLDVCGTIGPLLSFECVEWHLVDRVVRQYGEYSAMIGAPYSTNGFNNGRTATIVGCKIGICNLSLTLACLSSTVVVFQPCLYDRHNYLSHHSTTITAIIITITSIIASTTASTTTCYTASIAVWDTSGCINSHLEIDTGRLNVPIEAPSSLDLNAPTKQEVVDEYISSPFAPAEAGGSETVQEQTVGHQYNLQTDACSPNRFTLSSVNKIANKLMRFFKKKP